MADSTKPGTMRMWHYKNAGNIEKSLSLNESTTLPTAPKDPSKEVLVEVLAASLNPIDYKIAEIPFAGPYIFRKLTTPGLDFCGRVAQASTRGDSLAQGQLVAGRLDRPRPYGALSQFLVAPRSGLARLPDNVSAEDAAGLGTAGQTAYQTLVPFAKKGDTVFINGGSGGVGTFALQIAKIMGCRVVTSCSGANVALCKELGADEVIDYRSQDLVEELRKKGQVFDHVVDLMGKPYDLHPASESYLKPTGKFVQVGASIEWQAVKSMLTNMLLPGFLGGARRPFQFLSVVNKPEDLDQLVQWTAAGKLRVVIDKVYPYREATKAFEHLKTGRAVGKIIVSSQKGGKAV